MKNTIASTKYKQSIASFFIRNHYPSHCGISAPTANLSRSQRTSRSHCEFAAPTADLTILLLYLTKFYTTLVHKLFCTGSFRFLPVFMQPSMAYEVLSSNIQNIFIPNFTGLFVYWFEVPSPKISRNLKNHVKFREIS